MVPALLLFGAACNSDRLDVPPYNSPTPGTIAGDPSTGIPLAASGIINDDRLQWAAYVHDVSIFGREAYDYTATEAGLTSGFLQQNPLSPGFASTWTGRFAERLDVKNFLTSVSGSSLSQQSRNAAFGFAKTFDALTLHYLIETRFNLGVPVDINDNPRELAPFVPRDSVFSYISTELDAAKASLAAGGSSFPFGFPPGFAGFDTPAGFLKFNRAIAARVYLERATLGSCAACFQLALGALSESFIATDGSLNGLDAGVYRTFSTATGDRQNSIAVTTAPNFVAHVSFVADSAEQRADGTPDLRYQRKIKILATPRKAQNPTLGVTTPIQQNVYPSATSPAPIVRNEELILIRAEAKLGLGDNAGALADINYIRTVSGGLPASALTSASGKTAFITEILRQRKWSLFMEGVRWFDVRRYDRLTDLPLDLPTHFRQVQMPIPLNECLARVGSTMPGPGC